jgi:hypothetical protein
LAIPHLKYIILPNKELKTRKKIFFDTLLKNLYAMSIIDA